MQQVHVVAALLEEVGAGVLAQPPPVSHDVATVVEEAADLMRATIPSTVQIRIKEQPVGQVRADPNQIHQVVVNLCTNAAQMLCSSWVFGASG